MWGRGVISSVFGIMQESSSSSETEVRTLIWFLRETVMEDLDRTRWRRKSFKQRLGLKGMACCGATWGIRSSSTLTVIDDDDDDGGGQAENPQLPQIETDGSDPLSLTQTPAGSGMNLATALAVERLYRSSQEVGELSGVVDHTRFASIPTRNEIVETCPPRTPLKISLMRLLEESDGVDLDFEKEKDSRGNDSVCCVCMGRKKGSAFIPCGHTFCRVCSKELWLSRMSCPLCNRSILEILDIY